MFGLAGPAIGRVIDIAKLRTIGDAVRVKSKAGGGEGQLR